MVKSHPQELVLIAARVHLFPFRTQKLSSLAPTILGGRLPGKIGNANTESTKRNLGAFSFTHNKCLGQSTGLSPRHRQSLAYPESQVMPTQKAPGEILVLFSFTHKKCLGQSTGLSPRHRQSLAYPESQIMSTQRAPGAILMLFLFICLLVCEPHF